MLSDKQKQWALDNLKGLTLAELKNKYPDKFTNPKFLEAWGWANLKTDKPVEDKKKSGTEEGEDEMVDLMEIAKTENWMIVDDRKSQVERLYKLLKDGKPHNTNEIQKVVYGMEHTGTARISARIGDIKKKYHVSIPHAVRDKQIKSLSWYKITN